MPSTIKTPRTIAAEYISQRHFHRRFVLPRTETHGELAVTYADVGVQPDTTTSNHVPTFLFIPGMFGSRYLGVYIHAIAEKFGVRVLCVDRPGMGGSASVPSKSRVEIWVELVPLLLNHLGIDHVSLISHSAGTIYLLNTLVSCRDILDPDHPYIACLAPWVDPAHSHKAALQLARFIPTKAFSYWNQIPRFFQTSPVISFSGTVISSIKDKLPSNSGGDSVSYHKRQRLIEQEYGMAKDVQIELEKNITRFLFKENTVGANEETLQCLRKGAPWGVCDDYEEFVKSFVERERERRSELGESSTPEKLKIRAYFAESDVMIGKTGQKYFENCFEGYEDVLSFESSTMPDEDHDSLCSCPEVLARIFQERSSI
ncbi:conserved hypothetical protein [Talaromyces stipitatus ATCC 10500]|uniref:AB hydrolase-1 domain-containing protein n=1 Tax=Talaromyces stipitatus (strain ATCC 10500 / CBS 375.48 / QM 6759 / NRRL 1006) TaxID=441959 RepID=B8LTL0_TALSN|nr:uncharacterized protein TSTA_065440 [Talaromyces stipitatus ATCC 10500]EED23088.1 conserved hypothetical protein [Talaromyces stipitatus ATCC 10500]